MNFKKVFLLAAIGAAAAGAGADVRFDYKASVVANASTGDFAPYMIGSWDYGRYVNGQGLWHDGKIVKEMNLGQRFDWGAGAEYIVGVGSKVGYDRYDDATSSWGINRAGQAPARIHQLYGELKYRAVYLIAGMKERRSRIVDGDLSSGDLVRSNNAAPVPGVAAGFLDFQNIPFTNGWVQIDGEIFYGKFFDNKSLRDRFSYYNNLIPQDLMMTYKRCYFRTKPSMPFSVTVGMQTSGIFGGNTTYYTKGKVTRRDDRGFHLRDIWDMFFPMEGSGENYYKGNSLGSWDFKARYNFRNGSRLEAYFEWPWEDGSGIGRRNGWDGVWGLQYNFAQEGPVTKVLFEYLDFVNQGGPIHYSPVDYPGTTIFPDVNGGDDYYNNGFYGGYTNFGMSLGSAFMLAPVYNTDGYLQFAHNRCRGFHAAVVGRLAPAWHYSAKVSYQKAGGEGRYPSTRFFHDTSAMAQACWKPAEGKLKGLEVKAQLAFDAGSLRGNNFGGLVSVAYSGSFVFKRK